ncbi:hypothetical protein [Pseudoalteromonas ruthenica]|uniref:Tetratricopeptide repeat protein n=1 Tax=Pseudoalteromonas ruthenica TaxID=151081 RepID=A0A0F4PYV5_9GAMM|nr:hypothetical protein [Pseudoalteromonas ruthenica]KJY95529.1 hypothetical protein TW76_13060 [Pseudoalteromonas ruthenica]KJZ00583.1 hypothetical protein TW72_07885 [Pseudoalteromonas ruthenica]TMO87412.1 hypothetical protein CWC12_11895 [Pseudoalteromonas ruthenica]TMO94227.1 hypothetical protein CWC13_02330 [Pseudoalteromonas ruthenica]TMP01304.1 hypothetical protein CWC07_03025 [Pseudoalteromonas ruthenica]
MKLVTLSFLFAATVSVPCTAHLEHIHEPKSQETRLNDLSFDELVEHIAGNKFVTPQPFTHKALSKELAKRTSDDRPTSHFWRASMLQRAHHFQPALNTLEHYLTLRPSDANALLLKANIETVLGSFDKALATCLSLAAKHSVDLAMVCTLDVKMQSEPLQPIITRLAHSPLREGNSELAYFTQELFATALYFDGQYLAAKQALSPMMGAKLSSSTWLLFADTLMALGQAQQFVEEFSRLNLNIDDIPDALIVRLAHAAPKQWLARAQQRMAHRLADDANNYADALAYYFYHVVDDPITALHWAKQQTHISALKVDTMFYEQIQSELRAQTIN